MEINFYNPYFQFVAKLQKAFVENLFYETKPVNFITFVSLNAQ